jgi:hypothetical protein
MTIAPLSLKFAPLTHRFIAPLQGGWGGKTGGDIGVWGQKHRGNTEQHREK